MNLPASIAPGWNYDEAVTLLSFAQKTYDHTPGMPPDPVKIPCQVPVPEPPANWQIDPSYTPTEATPLDNFWQVWKNAHNPNQFVIAVRGTVGTAPSVLEDLLLPMVQARADLKIAGVPLPFHLARAEPGSNVVAGVHAGFALGLLSMLLLTDRPLLATLAGIAANPDAEVYITGHSQGASVALLLTSLVRHSTTLFKGPSYKSYVFAPTKPGNDHYAYDLDLIAALGGRCYTIVNTQGWVPQIPLTIETIGTVNRPNPIYEYSGALDPEIPKALQDLLGKIETAVKDVEQFVKETLEDLINELKGKLAGARLALKADHLDEAAAATQITTDSVSGVIDQLIALLIPGLNYAKAGTLVPLFGTPGGNPDDPKDFFWQHHLCNYLLYLQQQKSQLSAD